MYPYLAIFFGSGVFIVEVILVVRHWSAISREAFWLLLVPCLVQIIARLLLYREFRIKIAVLDDCSTKENDRQAKNVTENASSPDLETTFTHTLFLSFLTELLLLGFVAYLFGDI